MKQFAAALSVILFGVVAPAVAVPPIEGDADLLPQLRELQRKSQEAVRRGRIVGTAGTGRSKDAIDVVWDGRMLRADHHFEVKAALEPEPMKWHRIILETPDDAVSLDTRSSSSWEADPRDASKWLRKTASTLTLYPPGGRTIGGRPAVFTTDGVPRPLRDWFGLEGQLPWAELLDPERARTVQRYVVRRNGDDAVVERHQDNGAIFLMAFSLAKGGNIVSYEYVAIPRAEADRARHRDRSGRFEWEQAANGVWWLRSCNIERVHSSGRMLRHEFRATAFDPNPKIPPGFFTVSGLPVAEGTMLFEQLAENSSATLGDALPSRGVTLPPLNAAPVE